MLTPHMGNAVPEGRIWGADSGRFASPKKYSDASYLKWLGDRSPENCLFATAPDVVGDHQATLFLSVSMLKPIRDKGYKVAFVAQDGINGEIPWDEIDCLFIGGTTEFKLGHLVPGLVKEARSRAKWVHMGRVNSYKRLRLAALIGCQSADGTFLKYAPTENIPRLQKWLDKLRDEPMLDLNHGSGLAIKPPDFADRINEAIDRGIIERRAKEPPRNYLGASLLGDPCTRRLVYIATNTKPDADFTPRTIRIFDVGHEMEDFLGGGSESDSAFKNAAARWFHDAFFGLRTRDSKGMQFRWQSLGGKISGAIDGVFLSGPSIEDMIYPALWECKSLNKKGWSKHKKHGVRIASETYFGQMQLNMAYLDVFHCVFTAINKDTSELTHEMVEFDPAVAQRLSDRALEVVTMASKGELPDRIASQSDYYLCKMCSFYKRCWGL